MYFAILYFVYLALSDKSVGIIGKLEGTHDTYLFYLMIFLVFMDYLFSKKVAKRVLNRKFYLDKMQNGRFVNISPKGENIFVSEDGNNLTPIPFRRFKLLPKPDYVSFRSECSVYKYEISGWRKIFFASRTPFEYEITVPENEFIHPFQAHSF